MFISNSIKFVVNNKTLFKPQDLKINSFRLNQGKTYKYFIFRLIKPKKVLK